MTHSLRPQTTLPPAQVFLSPTPFELLPHKTLTDIDIEVDKDSYRCRYPKKVASLKLWSEDQR